MSKIYVIKDEGKFNLSGALEYGDEIIPIFIREIPVWSSTGPYVSQMDAKLARYMPDDYLLVVGDPVGIFMAGMILDKRGFKKVKLLKWDNRQKAYFPVIIEI